MSLNVCLQSILIIRSLIRHRWDNRCAPGTPNSWMVRIHKQLEEDWLFSLFLCVPLTTSTAHLYHHSPSFFRLTLATCYLGLPELLSSSLTSRGGRTYFYFPWPRVGNSSGNSTRECASSQRFTPLCAECFSAPVSLQGIRQKGTPALCARIPERREKNIQLIP